MTNEIALFYQQSKFVWNKLFQSKSIPMTTNFPLSTKTWTKSGSEKKRELNEITKNLKFVVFEMISTESVDTHFQFEK